MHTAPDPKAMAKSLRQTLSERRIELTHSESLECVARQLGWQDWNTLAAQLNRPKPRLPKGWITSGSRPDHYEMGVDEAESCAVIRHRNALANLRPADEETGFATLMQSVEAKRYLGKRLRLSAQMKTQGVDQAATIWLRIDAAGGRTLAFDNMETRQENGVLSGTVGWQDRSIVLDVSDQGESVHFGFYLRGPGTVWARRFRIEEVDPSIPVTQGGAPYKPGPENLDFSSVA